MLCRLVFDEVSQNLSPRFSRRRLLAALASTGLVIFSRSALAEIPQDPDAGTLDWIIKNPAAQGEIAGYANQNSFAEGEELLLYVSTREDNAAFSIDFFRMGWYDGQGAARALSVTGLKGRAQGYWNAAEGRRGFADSADARPFEPRWQPTYAVLLDARFQPGVYLAKLTSQSQAEAYVPFVVRAKDPARVVNLPTNTWQAYNIWGGQSLYFGIDKDGKPQNALRAYRVALNRPYDAGTLPTLEFGKLAGKFFVFDYPLVRWLEKEGAGVGYSTDEDLHYGRLNWAPIRLLISSGHDEYWTAQMRDAVEAARDRGTNLAFLSGNSVYWQARIEQSPAAEGGILTCYKAAEMDHVADRSLATDSWLKVGRPQSQLTGLLFGGVVSPPQYRPMKVVNTSHWLYEGTRLSDGDPLPGLVGYEYDRFREKSGAPETTIVLSESPVSGERGNDHANSAIYVAQSGAQVFAAGTMAFSWGLDSWGHMEVGNFEHPAVKVLARNLLERLG